jgi:hypothetical protein
MRNALVHRIADVDALTQHITLLYENREFLATLKAEALRSAAECTWSVAGQKLLDVYREVLAGARPAMNNSRPLNTAHGENMVPATV